MLRETIDKLELGSLDVLMVENMGNLVCPVEFHIGEAKETLDLFKKAGILSSDSETDTDHEVH